MTTAAALWEEIEQLGKTDPIAHRGVMMRQMGWYRVDGPPGVQADPPDEAIALTIAIAALKAAGEMKNALVDAESRAMSRRLMPTDT